MNSEHHTYNCIDNTYINVHCWLLFILVGIVKEKTHTRTSYTRQFSPLVGWATWFILLTRKVWLSTIWTYTHSNLMLTQTKTQCLLVSFLIVFLILPPPPGTRTLNDWTLFPSAHYLTIFFLISNDELENLELNLSRYPFNSHEWPRQNFFLQYQYNRRK